MPSVIPGFDPRFFRPCIFPLLRELGYGTRVSVNNGVGPESPLAMPMAVSMSVYDNDGGRIGGAEPFVDLAPGEIVKLDIDSELARVPGVPVDGPLLIILHVVPTKWAGVDEVDIPAAEMMAHVRSSDDFIEYHQRPKGVITGVAYQTGPLNDPRLSSTRTTVCQAPKVIVSEPVDTLFSLMNVSTRPDYSETVRMDFWILGRDGQRMVRSYVDVPPFSFRLVSATETLEQAGVLDAYREAGGVGMFLGLSANGTLVPISLTRNRQTGAIACDHTLPPVFYLSTWGGEARKRANARLAAEFFPDVVVGRTTAGGRRMTALAQARRRLGESARRRAAVSGRPPRFAYTHYFIETEGLHSRIHLQNFYDVLAANPRARDGSHHRVRRSGAGPWIDRARDRTVRLAVPGDVRTAARAGLGSNSRDRSRSISSLPRRSGASSTSYPTRRDRGEDAVLDGLLRRRRELHVRPFDRHPRGRGVRRPEGAPLGDDADHSSW